MRLTRRPFDGRRIRILYGLKMLVGKELRLIEEGYITISRDGYVAEIGEGVPALRSKAVNCRGLLAIPTFLNAHTHVADSAFRDATFSNVENTVHPIYGIKARLLKETSATVLRTAISDTVAEMLRNGISMFADCREGGGEGALLLRRALKNNRVRCVILSQPNVYDAVEACSLDKLKNEVIQALHCADGLCLSGPAEYTDEALEAIRLLCSELGKPVAIHAGESKEANMLSYEKHGVGEVERVLNKLKPSMIIHAVNASEKELRLAREAAASIVLCPRSNVKLGAGFPDVKLMLRIGIKPALGTDNVMLCEPSMFKEMQFLINASRMRYGYEAVEPREILKMCTVYAAEALNTADKLGSIEEGKKADILFLDASLPKYRFSRDLVRAVVERGSESDVRCVMIGGKVAYGRL